MRIIVIPKPKAGKESLPIVMEAAYIMIREKEGSHGNEYLLECKTYDGSLFKFEISKKMAYKLIGPNPVKMNSKMYYAKLFPLSAFHNENVGKLLTSWGVIVDLVHNEVREVILKTDKY